MISVPALNDKQTGAAFVADTPHSLANGGMRYPVVRGIPYLRAGRPEFTAGALAALDAGDELEAAAILLRDQDPFAPLPPPTLEVTRRLAKLGRAAGFRAAMRELNFGPVADYFAHRTSVPTYLSGLALLSRGLAPGVPVVELACGVGHFLRDLGHRHFACVGVDLVFAKLWLARTFVAPSATLVCADVADVPPGLDGPATAFCHDAFYFFPHKQAVAATMLRLAGPGGAVLVGHAHNKLIDSGIAGTPLTPGGYGELFPGATLCDDAELADEARTGKPAPTRTPAELAGAEAVSIVFGWESSPRPDLAVPPAGVPLVLNPLLEAVDGALFPRWPSERFAREYAAATYLTGEPVPPPELLRAAMLGERSAGIDRLARNRILLDVPGGW